LSNLYWADALADPLHTASPISSPPDPGYASSKPSINWAARGPAFLNADTKKNNHELVPTGIPDMLCMMIHLKLFIPLSMLTTASLSRIRFNDNLKFKKIPISNVAGKYALDESHFPSEDSLRCGILASALTLAVLDESFLQTCCLQQLEGTPQ